MLRWLSCFPTFLLVIWPTNDVRFTSVCLYCHRCCVRWCVRLPAIYCQLLGQIQVWHPLHCPQELWGQGCHNPAEAEGCSAPGSLCCWHSLWSQGGSCPIPFQPAWHCIASWPVAGRGALYPPPGVDARQCGAQWSCSSRSGHCGCRTAPTTGYRLLGGQEHLEGDPSRTHQWSNSHTYAHGSVAPRSPPSQS